MLDAHFFFGGQSFAVGAEPDLLYAVGSLVTDLGGSVAAAVTTTRSPILEHVPTAEVVIGDLEDLEARAGGCAMLLTHAHGRQASQRLDIPLYRVGIPMFDRLGATHRVSVGYRGTRDFVFELANVLMATEHGHAPDHWPLPPAALAAARGETALPQPA
jgi:nitrogenase molybdenum-iron protein NifN